MIQALRQSVLKEEGVIGFGMSPFIVDTIYTLDSYRAD